MVKISKSELVTLDVDDESVVKKGNKELSVPSEVADYMKKLGLSPTSSSMKEFYESVLNFHMTATKFLQKYFKKALQSTILDKLSSLSPKKQSHIKTYRNVQYLFKKFSKVLKNIDVDGVDKAKEDLEQYVTDEDVKLLKIWTLLSTGRRLA